VGFDSYLNCLSEKVPTSTFTSHKYQILEFNRWLQSQNASSGNLSEQTAEFIYHLTANKQHSVDTIGGYVRALSNFIAYCRQDDPELVSVSLLATLQEKQACEDLIEQVFGNLTKDSGPSGVTENKIDTFISYLRRSRFGSRTHAYVETILDTVAPVKKIQQIDLPDFDGDQILGVGISDQSLVGKFNLVASRDVEIAENTTEVLDCYIDYSRNGSSNDGSVPLFTTAHGRAARSTLRRSVRRVSEDFFDTSDSVSEDHLNRLESSSKAPCIVLPSDIRWYALRKQIRST